jgi:hypothetical protein
MRDVIRYSEAFVVRLAGEAGGRLAGGRRSGL